ncbi:MAG: amidohydrolase family protein [Candidatus Kariarchaeaceae archaeon]|jgi:predicted TIM-barrel fold metal-dependent hydrolase
MIIDSHVHVGEPPTKKRHWNTNFSNGKVLEIDWGEDIDMSSDRLIEDMNQMQIDKSLVMAFPGWVSNEYLADVVKASSNRFIGFGYVNDPKSPKSMEEIEYCVNSLGLQGLKLHPGTQMFESSDPKIIPLIKKTVDLNIPILIHSFPWPEGYTHYSFPHHIDVLKREVPDAIIIVGHMGGMRFMDLVGLSSHTDIFFETSFTLNIMNNLYGIDFVTKFIKMIGPAKVVFGSDWAGNIQRMENPFNVIQKLNMSDEEKQLILGGNIEQMLMRE